LLQFRRTPGNQHAISHFSSPAPYFHNNSAETLEDFVIHYEEFAPVWPRRV